MLTIAYVGGGRAKGSCLRNNFWIFLALDKTFSVRKIPKNPLKMTKKSQKSQNLVEFFFRDFHITYTVFPHIISAETILF